MLALRAGLGAGPALTRAQVAQRLAIGVPEVIRLERRGVRRLGALAHDGRCAAGGSNGDSDAALALGASSGEFPFGSADGQPAGAVGSASGVKGVSAHGSGDDSGGPSVALPVEDPGVVVALLLLAAALGVVALAVRRELRNR